MGLFCRGMDDALSVGRSLGRVNLHSLVLAEYWDMLTRRGNMNAAPSVGQKGRKQRSILGFAGQYADTVVGRPTAGIAVEAQPDSSYHLPLRRRRLGRMQTTYGEEPFRYRKKKRRKHANDQIITFSHPLRTSTQELDGHQRDYLSKTPAPRRSCVKRP